MKFCDEKIQKHLLSGGKVKRHNNNNVWSYRPILINDKNVLVFADTKDYYNLTKLDLTADDWEIVEPEYNWDKIIKDKILCVFSHQENFEYKAITTLDRRDNQDGTYFTSQGVWYSHCKPFNPADFNIAKDLKEYEK